MDSLADSGNLPGRVVLMEHALGCSLADDGNALLCSSLRNGFVTCSNSRFNFFNRSLYGRLDRLIPECLLCIDTDSLLGRFNIGQICHLLMTYILSFRALHEGNDTVFPSEHA